MAAGNIWTRVAISSDSSLPPAHQRLDIHDLGAALRFRAAGKITTNGVLVSAFNFDADGQADLAAMVTAYLAAANKVEWLALLEGAFQLVSSGKATEAQAKNWLGIV